MKVEMESILWPNVVKPFAVRILKGCGASLRSENKNKWGVMWLKQAKSISQEVGDIPDKAEREEK